LGAVATRVLVGGRGFPLARRRLWRRLRADGREVAEEAVPPDLVLVGAEPGSAVSGVVRRAGPCQCVVFVSCRGGDDGVAR